MTADTLVGIDVGGTKTHILIETADGHRLSDRVFATANWRGASDVAKARQIRSWISELLPNTDPAAVAVGAHGCDSDEESESLRQQLLPLVDTPTLVVNDSQLLAAAAGKPGSIELVAGTGSIAVGRNDDGRSVYAGGWGWLLGDEGGAAGLVRGAVQRLTRAQDDGQPRDPLEHTLLTASGANDLRSLSMLMMSGTEFTTWAPLLFDAADEGSTAAIASIQNGAGELARLVRVLFERGVQAQAVVAAGSVIVNQSRLSDALRDALTHTLDLELIVLDSLPVHGAINLARLLHDSTAPSPSIGQLFSARANQRKE